MAEVQEHRNGVQSIEVELTSILDDDGNELNDWFGKKPGTRHNIVRGEAEKLISRGRAIAVSNIKPTGKVAPKNRGKSAPNTK